MDVVGPLPRTKRGNMFFYANRLRNEVLEAILLRCTDARSVANELLSVFARVGIPDEKLTDQGSNFVSKLVKNLFKLLGVQYLRTTPLTAKAAGC